MRLIAILCAAIVQGCYAVPGETIQVLRGEDGFDDAELATMRVESDRLCRLTDGAYCPVLTRETAANVARKTSSGLDDGSLGRTDISQGTFGASLAISIKPGLNEQDFRLVWMHELGHAGGCLVHLAPGNIMTAEIEDGTDDWTAMDIACIDGMY